MLTLAQRDEMLPVFEPGLFQHYVDLLTVWRGRCIEVDHDLLPLPIRVRIGELYPKWTMASCWPNHKLYHRPITPYRQRSLT